MSHESAVRVVYENVPYLVVEDAGEGPRVFGPFIPGTEPSLAECTPERRVTDPAVVAVVMALRPISPAVPPNASSLAGRE